MSTQARGRAASLLWALRHGPWVLLVYATRAVAAFVVASALAAVATRVVGRWPSGELALFEPGGLMLSELLRVEREHLSALLTHGGLVAIAMIPIGIVTSTLLLVSLSEDRRVHLSSALHRCGKHLTPTVVVYLVTTCLQVAVVWFFYILAELLSVKLLAALGVRGADIAYGFTIGFGLMLGLLIAIVHDVTRAAIVVRSYDTLQSIALGWGMARRQPIEVLAAYFPRAAGSILVVMVAIVFARRLGLNSLGGIVGATLLQQAAVISLVVLRASWLSRAAEMVEAGSRPESDAIGAAEID